MGWGTEVDNCSELTGRHVCFWMFAIIGENDPVLSPLFYLFIFYLTRCSLSPFFFFAVPELLPSPGVTFRTWRTLSASADVESGCFPVQGTSGGNNPPWLRKIHHGFAF